MSVLIGLLPIILWMVAVIVAVAIIVITINRGHVFTPRSRRSPVEPVRWSMVKTHFMSFAMALVPFPVFTFLADSMDVRLREFCDQAQLPGMIIVFILVLLELIAMYLQSRNAAETQMDRKLGVVARDGFGVDGVDEQRDTKNASDTESR